MARISPLPLKGTRDWLPRDLVRRDRVFALLRGAFERYGFEPLETPSIESTAVLEGKYGEEGERLLFRVLKRGRDLESGFRSLDAIPAGERTSGDLTRAFSDEALRYDLTVPFARVIAAHQNDLVLPFRRFQMQTVWRGDRPQRGRYREFFQCDVDCVGSRSMTVDAEMALIYREVFDALGLTDSITKINHRGLLTNIMQACNVPIARRVATLTAIDKLDKIGLDGVRDELYKAELNSDIVNPLMEVIAISGQPAEVIERLRPLIAGTDDGEANLREIADVFIYATEMGMPPERYSFDLSLVRGLGYYTGTIYETVLPGSTLGSLGGGGRYDQLIGMFLGRDLPCVGISFGIERIFDALDERRLLADESPTVTQALVPLFAPETYAAAFALANDLRRAGIRTELYPDAKELRAQLTFANKKGIPLVALIGPDEIAAGTVVLRDLRTGTQHPVPRAEVATQALALLGH